MAKVKGAGGDTELYVYEGAGHAFLNAPESKLLPTLEIAAGYLSQCIHGCIYKPCKCVAKVCILLGIVQDRDLQDI